MHSIISLASNLKLCKWTVSFSNNIIHYFQEYTIQSNSIFHLAFVDSEHQHIANSHQMEVMIPLNTHCDSMVEAYWQNIYYLLEV